MKEGIMHYIQWFRDNKDTVLTWDDKYIPPDILNEKRGNQDDDFMDEDDTEHKMNEPQRNPYDRTEAWKRIGDSSQRQKSVSIGDSDNNHNNMNKSSSRLTAVPVNHVTTKFTPEQIAEACILAFEMIDTKNFRSDDVELIDEHPLFPFYIHKEHQLWWWLNEIACSYYCIGGANVASERTFKMLKSLVGPTQNQMEMSTVKDMIIIKESLIAEDSNNKMRKKYDKLLPTLFNLFMTKTSLAEDQIIIENVTSFLHSEKESREQSSMLLFCLISNYLILITCYILQSVDI